MSRATGGDTTETIDIDHAKTHLLKLIDWVSRGEEITIARAGKPPAGERRPGSARGLVEIGDDFDAPLPRSFFHVVER